MTVLWSWKVLIKNMGKAVKIELVTSNRLAWESKVEVHVSLLSHLLTSGRKSITFGFVRPRGKPR
jgi:hypothetical protein